MFVFLSSSNYYTGRVNPFHDSMDSSPLLPLKQTNIYIYIYSTRAGKEAMQNSTGVLIRISS